MLELDLSLVGWVHTIVCVVAMLAFVPVMFARKGGRRHRTFGRVYSLAYVAVCATSLGIYSQQRFWFPHWLALEDWLSWSSAIWRRVSSRAGGGTFISARCC